MPASTFLPNVKKNIAPGAWVEILPRLLSAFRNKYLQISNNKRKRGNS